MIWGATRKQKRNLPKILNSPTHIEVGFGSEYLIEVSAWNVAALRQDVVINIWVKVCKIEYTKHDTKYVN